MVVIALEPVSMVTLVYVLQKLIKPVQEFINRIRSSERNYLGT